MGRERGRLNKAGSGSAARDSARLERALSASSRAGLRPQNQRTIVEITQKHNAQGISQEKAWRGGGVKEGNKDTGSGCTAFGSSSEEILGDTERGWEETTSGNTIQGCT